MVANSKINGYFWSLSLRRLTALTEFIWWLASLL